jgi:Na+/melibiose symporter-like transporter
MSDSEKKVSLLQIPHYRILSYVALASFISWSAWLLVFLKLDPFESPELALPLFFFSFFLALAGTFTILLFFIKKWRTHDEVFVKHVMISLRQGLLLSFCASICLALLMLGLLRVWNGLLIVIFITLLEFYFSSKDELL